MPMQIIPKMAKQIEDEPMNVKLLQNTFLSGIQSYYLLPLYNNTCALSQLNQENSAFL
jgi:hypothetical protein